MFKLIHKNRKGVSLSELLIVIAVLALLLPLAGRVLYNLLSFNNTVIDRWDVQTATRLACNDFENNKDGLTNAFQVDLIYDPSIENGVILKNNGEIEWRNGATSAVMNPEGISVDAEAHKSDVYTYIYSAATYDEEGAYLGKLLYMRSYGDNRSHLMLNDYGMGKVPVSVTFSMGTTKDMQNIGSPFYTENTIMMHFRSGKETVTFGYETSFAIINTTRPINYIGDKLACEESWADGGKASLAHVAGWDNYNLNYDSSGQLTTNNGFPKAKTATDGSGAPLSYYETNCVTEGGTAVIIDDTFNMEYKDTSGATQTVNAPVLAREANIMRYKSPTAEKTQGEAVDKSSNTNVAGCLTGFAMMGSDMAEKVLGNLRMFRDNVLKGTTFGDWFIHEYYYTWSPFLIEHTAFLKPVYKAVLIPVSCVCGFIARL